MSQPPAARPRVETAPDGSLIAVCVVHAIIPNPGETPDVTAIDKRPREGRLEVGPLGFTADTQVDRKYHGGEEQALYTYADEDAAWWARELDRRIPAGAADGLVVRTRGDLSSPDLV